LRFLTPAPYIYMCVVAGEWLAKQECGAAVKVSRLEPERFLYARIVKLALATQDIGSVTTLWYGIV
jgi:hypothetical protein